MRFISPVQIAVIVSGRMPVISASLFLGILCFVSNFCNLNSIIAVHLSFWYIKTRPGQGSRIGCDWDRVVLGLAALSLLVVILRRVFAGFLSVFLDLLLSALFELAFSKVLIVRNPVPIFRWFQRCLAYLPLPHSLSEEIDYLCLAIILYHV